MNNHNTIQYELLTILRDSRTTTRQFRDTAAQLARAVAYSTAHCIPRTSITVDTPFGKAAGVGHPESIMLVPILRSGIVLLPAFLEIFPHARVGVAGLKRDEQTAQAQWYYHNIPSPRKNEHIIVLDPMIATGGTGIAVVNKLKSLGAREQSILFVAIIGSRAGIERLQNTFPAIQITVVAQDPELNAQQFIVPGLGDFGDRYFDALNNV